MKAKKTKLAPKVMVNEVEEPIKVQEAVKDVPKIKYLTCPFCGEKDTELNGKDPTSSWCKKCGRCYPAIWSEA